MEQVQHVVSMKKQIRKLKNQLSDLEDRLHAVESTLRQQFSSAYQVANKQTLPIQISVSTTKSGVVDVTNIPDAKVDLSNKKPTSSDSVTTRPSSSKGLPQPRPVVTAQSTKSPQISTPTSVRNTKTVSHKVKLQSDYSNSTIKRFTLIPKFESTNRKVALDKIQPQAARLIRKGSEGVWVWNSEMQAGEYLSLKRKSTRPSLQKLVSRFSGWATDGKAGHSPPSTEMMPAKQLEKFKEFKGNRWYWFRGRWLLFTLHEE
ncbi:hypothetical protein BY996DRAFT_8542294 [Phakopsora pachyrhizi]|nr:hypothetical protein BY996DRAFT_8542294 [Phakopsora pachyrhizi]